MEVLVALMVFSIVLSTVIQIIGSARAIGKLSNVKQKQIDGADTIAKQIASGLYFIKILLTDAEKLLLREKMQKQYGNKIPSVIKEKRILNSVFQNKNIEILYQEKNNLKWRINRKVLAKNPWMLEIEIYDMIGNKASQRLYETNTNNQTKQPNSKSILVTILAENMIPPLLYDY